MILPFIAVSDAVARGDVRTGADEQVVKGEQTLSILQFCLCQSDGAHAGLTSERSFQVQPEVGRLKGQENPIETLGIRVDRQNWLSGHVFGGVGDQAILTQRDNDVVLREDIGWDQRSIHDLDLEPGFNRAPNGFKRSLVRIVFEHISREIPARVLDIELCLSPGVEALDQLIEARLARHQYNLLEHAFTPAARWSRPRYG